MRISLVISAAFLLGAASAHSQLFTPEVVASNGGYEHSAAMQLSWTVGEPMVETLHEGSLVMTEGFHQPTEEQAAIAAVPTTGDAGNAAVLYPNPFHKLLYVRAPSSWGSFELEVVNALGETVIERHHVDRDKYAVDFSNLPSGSYIARIWVKDSATPLIYQVTRVE